MKLIHCADLHLDSPMESGLPTEKARERRGEILSAFARLVQDAEENGAEAILIAGDLFDSERVSKKTVGYVTDLFRSHPGIVFFYLSGNHDRGTSFGGEDLPENVRTFGDGWTSYEIGGVTVTGSECPDEDTLSLPEDRVNIVLLHGQERRGAGAKTDDTIRFGKLKGKNIDYLALGHIHEFREYPLDRRGVACYSGCPEGRGFDECGKKGYVLLETGDRRVTYRFVPFAKRELHTVNCDVTDLTSQLDLTERARKTVGGIPSGDLVKLVLTGDNPVGTVYDIRHLEAELSDEFYFVKVRDESRIRIAPGDYANDISLKGEFVRLVMASPLSDAEKARVIACGFSALAGEEITL